jgi:hypothetical protein
MNTWIMRKVIERFIVFFLCDKFWRQSYKLNLWNKFIMKKDSISFKFLKGELTQFVLNNRIVTTWIKVFKTKIISFKSEFIL